MTFTRLAVVAFLTAGCAAGSHPASPAFTSTAADVSFLASARHNATLAAEDDTTLMSLGHEVCDLLGSFHGNTGRVDKFIVKTAGKGGAAAFSPPVMTALRGAATSVYCPLYR